MHPNNSMELGPGGSMGPKPPEKIKEDIIGIKTIIESLAEEVAKLEMKKKQHITEIKNNENLLNNILEDLSRDNKAFLAKLQTAVDKKTVLTLTASEPFVKRNFRKIKEMLEEKSLALDGEPRGGDRKRSENRSRNNSKDSLEERADPGERGRELEQENAFILRKLGSAEGRHVQGFLRALTAASQNHANLN